MAGERTKTGYGGRPDLGRTWRVTGLGQDMAGAGVRQDMEGDMTKAGYGEIQED
jgi:hypothetical protein